MSNPFTDTAFSYSNMFIGMGIHGVLGGRGTWLSAAASAARPSYWKRTTADFYYRIQDGTQQRVPWVLSDPLGTNCPTGKQQRLASAVHAWQALSEAEKETWRRLAHKWNMWRGYNLFLSRWLTGQI
jgi:hypothetical protein